MSAFADVKLSKSLDGSMHSGVAAAIDSTFSPRGYVQPGIAKWVDPSGGIAVGFPGFTLQVRPPSQASRVYKVTAKVNLPTLEQTSPSTSTGIQPAPMKAYDCSGIMEFLLPERSTAQERLNLFNTLASLFAYQISNTGSTSTIQTGSPLRIAVVDFDVPF